MQRLSKPSTNISEADARGVILCAGPRRLRLPIFYVLCFLFPTYRPTRPEVATKHADLRGSTACVGATPVGRSEWVVRWKTDAWNALNWRMRRACTLVDQSYQTLQLSADFARQRKESAPNSCFVGSALDLCPGSRMRQTGLRVHTLATPLEDFTGAASTKNARRRVIAVR
jgi:hypothetical protein